MTTTLEAKREGQERSRLRLTAEQETAFLDLVRELPAGTDFSVNLLRSRLDEHGIPDTSRGVLFRLALSLELIEPLTIRAGSWEAPVTEPSTGRSAHLAKVRVYRRTASS